MRSCQLTHTAFPAYLTRTLAPEDMKRIRDHLNTCPPCWDRWNVYRWDQAMGTPLYEEFTAYLAETGERLMPYFDSSTALATQWDAASPTNASETRAFWRHTNAYLYNLVIWHASGNRPPYVPDALPLLQSQRCATIIDYGCGIGTDTIALRLAGFTVLPVDLPSPHADFARWRFRRRRQADNIIDPRHINELAGADTIWIIDTLDHLEDPTESLGPILTDANLLISESLLNDREHGRQGFHHRRKATETTSLLSHYHLHPVTISRGGTYTSWYRNLPASGASR